MIFISSFVHIFLKTVLFIPTVQEFWWVEISFESLGQQILIVALPDSVIFLIFSKICVVTVWKIISHLLMKSGLLFLNTDVFTDLRTHIYKCNVLQREVLNTENLARKNHINPTILRLATFHLVGIEWLLSLYMTFDTIRKSGL